MGAVKGEKDALLKIAEEAALLFDRYPPATRFLAEASALDDALDEFDKLRGFMWRESVVGRGDTW